MVAPPRTGAYKVKSRLEGFSRGSPTGSWESLHRNTSSGRVRRLGRNMIILILLILVR